MDPARKRHGQTLFSRCTNQTNNVNRVHGEFVAFCSEGCGEDFHASLKAKGYDKTIVVAGLTPDVINASGAAFSDMLIGRVLALGCRYTNSICANCTARRIEGTPEFFSCMTCDRMCYCSTECLREHWGAGHDKACGKPSPPPALVFDRKQHAAHQRSEEKLHPECFNAVDLARRKASRKGKCAWPECGYKNAIELTWVGCPCKRGGPIHYAAILYCCAAHRDLDSIAPTLTGST